MALIILRDVIHASPAVATFRAALAGFEVDHRALGDQLARSDQTRFNTRYRFGSSGASVIAFGGPLLDAHVGAAIASVHSTTTLAQLPRHAPLTSPPVTEEEFRSWAELQRKTLEDFEAKTGRPWHLLVREALETTTVPFASLHACYQAFLYLLRAYQDRAYSVLLEVFGNNSGPKVSISKIIDRGGKFKTNASVGAFLAERCAAYGPWFARLKKMRDDLKFGAPTSTSGPDFDPGISLGYLEEDKQGVVADARNAYRLGDVAEALDRSRDLVREIQYLSERRAT